MTARLVPHPWLSAFLFATFVLATREPGVGTALLALVLALVIPRWTARFWPDAPRCVAALPLAGLVALVLVDILIANLRVARLILGPPSRLRPGFLRIPVELEQPFAITLFANIITLTPGTVSANLSGDRRTLLVHMLDVDDPDAAVREIKQRYERRVREVFTC